jgi:ABC-type phosphate transport system substrate-binding protein
MNQEQLIIEFDNVLSKMKDIVRKKNNDYTSNINAFKNFEEFGTYGFLVRMNDKLSRLKNLILNNKNPYVNESLEDTLIDLANYSVLLFLYLKTDGRKNEVKEQLNIALNEEKKIIDTQKEYKEYILENIEKLGQEYEKKTIAEILETIRKIK